MAVSDRPWSEISASDYRDAESYCNACLINLNDGPPRDWVKSACKLPVMEPSRDINRNACHAAAAVLAGGRGGVDAPAAAKRTAARRLAGMYRSVLKEDPPEALMRMM